MLFGFHSTNRFEIETAKIHSYGVDMIFNANILMPPLALDGVREFEYAISWALLRKDRFAYGKIDWALVAGGGTCAADFEGQVRAPVPFETGAFEVRVA